jgi:hypothetical protein
LFINLWSLSCAPCLVNYPKQQQLMKDVSLMKLDDSIVFINICTDGLENRDEWSSALVKRSDKSFNFIADTSIFDEWKMPVAWPTYVLIDRDGRNLGKKIPGPGEPIQFMLLAATKGISAKDAETIKFKNDSLLYRGEKSIDPLYLHFLSTYSANYLPYIIWWVKQKGR